MKIGDEVFVHGYVDEMRKDVVIIRNDGGYFGTDPCEVEVKTDNPQYVNGWLDALNEIMKYSYGMLDAEKFGLQHKIQSMIWDFMGDKVADTSQTETKRVGYCNECKWFRNKQVCGRCRSKNLFAEADTPQTDCDKCIWSVCNYNKVDWDADTPQTDEFKNFDREDLILLIEAQKERIGELLADKDTPQTEAVVKPYKPTNREILDAIENSDCPWK